MIKSDLVTIISSYSSTRKRQKKSTEKDLNELTKKKKKNGHLKIL